jgi:hypothetical protein
MDLKSGSANPIESASNQDRSYKMTAKHCSGSALVSIRIRIQLFLSQKMDPDPGPDQGAKLKRIHPDPDPGQTEKVTKCRFFLN